MYTTMTEFQPGYSACKLQKVIERFAYSDEQELVLSEAGYESISSLYMAYYSAVKRMRKSSTIKVRRRKGQVILFKV